MKNEGFTPPIYGCFLKWWYPTTMGLPTKNDHFGVFWGYHHLRKHPYMGSYIPKNEGSGFPWCVVFPPPKSGDTFYFELDSSA